MKKLFHEISVASVRNIVIILVVLGTYAVLFTLIYKPVPDANNELVYMAFGMIIGSGFGAVCAYLFGSSKNESDKQKNEANRHIP